jgi:hypothetical protein
LQLLLLTIMGSEDDYSDLTDLESDDYIESKSKKKSAAKSGGKSGYRIKNALKAPRATTYTAQALYGMELSYYYFALVLIAFTEQIHSCDINLEPEYQRGLIDWQDYEISLFLTFFFFFERRRVA